MIDIIGQGALVRLSHHAEAGEETHPTFRTERIANGKRIGSVLGRVVEVCENGCCIFVEPPEGGPYAVRVGLEDLLPLLEGDTDGSADGAQHA